MSKTPDSPDPVATATPTPRPSSPEDVENGLRFNHVVAMQNKQRLLELGASVNALLETLVAKGQLPLDDYERRRQVTMQREIERSQSESLVIGTNVADKYAMGDLPEIDCEARLPLCKARCCTFVFPLSNQDLDERVVRWEYARPYQIARREDGYCVHNRAGTCQCTVYANRPAVCRTYDCRKDTRVWIDFEQRIPAP